MATSAFISQLKCADCFHKTIQCADGLVLERSFVLPASAFYLFMDSRQEGKKKSPFGQIVRICTKSGPWEFHLRLKAEWTGQCYMRPGTTTQAICNPTHNIHTVIFVYDWTQPALILTFLAFPHQILPLYHVSLSARPCLICIVTTAYSRCGKNPWEYFCAQMYVYGYIGVLGGHGNKHVPQLILRI